MCAHVAPPCLLRMRTDKRGVLRVCRTSSRTRKSAPLTSSATFSTSARAWIIALQRRSASHVLLLLAIRCAEHLLRRVLHACCTRSSHSVSVERWQDECARGPRARSHLPTWRRRNDDTCTHPGNAPCVCFLFLTGLVLSCFSCRSCSSLHFCSAYVVIVQVTLSEGRHHTAQFKDSSVVYNLRDAQDLVRLRDEIERRMIERCARAAPLPFSYLPLLHSLTCVQCWGWQRGVQQNACAGPARPWTAAHGPCRSPGHHPGV